MHIRPERADDAAVISAVIDAAFAGAPHSDGTEGAILDTLRAADALTLSLVAVDEGVVIGHAAFSPVAVANGVSRWFGLGPVAVVPERQREGIGWALIDEGLHRLREIGAAGCVVLGDPGYYRRFGFAADHALHYSGAPAEYFQSLLLHGPSAHGEVTYHPAFDAADQS